MLKAVCTQAEFDALNEADKAHYKQEGELYLLQVTPVTVDKAVYALEDVGGLRSAMTRLKAENKDLKAEVTTYKTNFDGIDPEEAKAAIEKVKEIGDAKPDEVHQREIEAIEARLTAQHNKKVTELQAQVRAAGEKAERYLAHIKKSKIREVAMAAIQAERGSVALLLPHVEARCRIAIDPEDPENPDKFTIEVVGEDGQARLSMKPGAVGQNMTPAEYVSQMKVNDAFAVAFEGARAAGSGASGSSPQFRTTGRTIRKSDQAAIEANLDRIAKGEVTVVD